MERMAEPESANSDKAQVFFDRAQQATARSNFDYAIQMYLEGLRYDPDALEQGHLRLHELALLRQSKGGKKPSMVERMKRLRGKPLIYKNRNYFVVAIFQIISQFSLPLLLVFVKS